MVNEVPQNWLVTDVTFATKRFKIRYFIGTTFIDLYPIFSHYLRFNDNSEYTYRIIDN